MLASSLLVHHVMLTCAFMISVRLSDLLTQAKLFVPFLFAMDILEPLVYICCSPIDVPPAELWEGQSYLNCSCGDFVQFITKDYPLPRPRHRCVYALNLRTLHRGWLFQYRDEQLKVVGCLSDILTLVSQGFGLPLLQDAAPLLDTLPPAHEMHEDEPSLEYVPGSQYKHTPDPLPEYKPAGQSSHPTSPMLAVLPASHKTQDCWLVCGI